MSLGLSSILYPVENDIGYARSIPQRGGKHRNAKTLRGYRAGVGTLPLGDNFLSGCQISLQ
jgi:hypothetical protein